MPSSTPRVQRCRGFTMVEVLVAVLVLSFGLLGLAMLQVESMKHNTDAYFRTHATLLAYDIIDRMRANVEAANGGSYEVNEKPSTTETCGNAGGCANGAALANYDLGVWYGKLEEVLPAPSVPSEIQSEANIHTIIIRWAERDIQKSRTWEVEL